MDSRPARTTGTPAFEPPRSAAYNSCAEVSRATRSGVLHGTSHQRTDSVRIRTGESPSAGAAGRLREARDESRVLRAPEPLAEEREHAGEVAGEEGSRIEPEARERPGPQDAIGVRGDPLVLPA